MWRKKRKEMNFFLKNLFSFLKTGSLIAKSCQASAILGGQSEHICNLAYQYGRNLGLAFQV